MQLFRRMVGNGSSSHDESEDFSMIHCSPNIAGNFRYKMDELHLSRDCYY